jgi:mRNA-degrading endonuclease YafQ of YafQ-DinJ toxin-antitoxin module
MARKQPFLDIEFAEQFKKSYSSFQSREQDRIDEVVMALAKGVSTPGMRIKPIEPEKYYREARVNDGDRVVFRIANDTLLLADVVPHDLISGYGKRR